MWSAPMRVSHSCSLWPCRAKFYNVLCRPALLYGLSCWRSARKGMILSRVRRNSICKLYLTLSEHMVFQSVCVTQILTLRKLGYKFSCVRYTLCGAWARFACFVLLFQADKSTFPVLVVFSSLKGWTMINVKGIMQRHQSNTRWQELNKRGKNNATWQE